MNGKTRWVLLTLFLCAIVGIVIDSGVLKSKDDAEPGRLRTEVTRVPQADALAPRRLPPLVAQDASFFAETGVPPDSAVRFASHQVVRPLAVAARVLGQSGSDPLRIAEKSTQISPVFVWPITEPTSDVHVRSSAITVTVPGKPGEADSFSVTKEDGELLTETGNFVAASDEPVPELPAGKAIDVDLSQRAKLSLAVTRVGAHTPIHAVTIYSPSSRTPPAPTVRGVAAHQHGDTKPPSGQFRVFEPNPYVRLEGRNYVQGTDFFFFQAQASESTLSLTRIPGAKAERVPDQETAWKAEFPVNGNDGMSSAIVVLSVRKNNEGANYSQPLSFTIGPQQPLDRKLAVAKVTHVGKAASLAAHDVYFANRTTLDLHGNDTIPPGVQVVAYRKGDDEPIGLFSNTADTPATEWKVTVSDLPEGRQQVYVALEQGNRSEPESRSDLVTIAIRKSGPRVVRVEPSNFGQALGVTALTVFFNENNPLDSSSENTDYFTLLRSNGSGVFDRGTEQPVGAAGSTTSVPNPRYDPNTNSMRIVYQNVVSDVYQLTVHGEGITDLYANELEGIPGKSGTDYVTTLGKLAAAEHAPGDALSVRPGITGATGEYVPFNEFVKPRKVPDGFNPNDKVETRVVRLYYYRDAHRVAQIVNRKVKSHNRQGVDMARQLADKSRTLANQATESRKEAERAAIIRAQETRRIENQLRAAEQRLNRAVQELTNARRQGAPADSEVVQSLDATARSFSAQVDDLRRQIEDARVREIEANELSQQLEGKERLARGEQFRREKAAAHADPDTYAPGRPKSDDPVEQVSISVIGEGLIHLRGPLKGINVIRTMIDQIDQPVGQVRVAVHTVQINGEREERMEDVANVVQLYIDHARFLTMQSSEMLRKAVVQVAARKAEEAMPLGPSHSQEGRDHRYLYAFFGKEFIDELAAMDSEFLKTGNKLLSLHSMDTTSLSSALNLLALAKNSTRLEILEEFQQMTQGELPMIEASYLEAGMTACKKRFGLRCPPKFYPMADRARFESLRGFFNSQIAHDDTLTPLQREFIRLAQIFKGRLITELEYKQRVMERAIIEDRLGDRIKELEDAKTKEEEAENALARVQDEVANQRTKILGAYVPFLAILRGARKSSVEAQQLLEAAPRPMPVKGSLTHGTVQLDGRSISVVREDYNSKETGEETTKIHFDDPRDEGLWKERMQQALRKAEETRRFLDSLALDRAALVEKRRAIHERLEALHSLREGADRDVAELLLQDFRRPLQEVIEFENDILEDVGIRGTTDVIDDMIERQALQMLDELSEESPDIIAVYGWWVSLRKKLLDTFSSEVEGDLWKRVQAVEDSLDELTKSAAHLTVAQETAKRSRRPLDHKKFLDMLIDDLEEKYIELLDGTRAHTANVDSYLKRLTTALDDDFNTQFYHPAFRYIREASTYHDVQFGQTETTSILANNRAFAKVDPSATMEFDLPARDNALTEALIGAKAMMNDVGALANDPTFLAMAKSRVNSSSDIPPGASGGFGVVRDVLPGLDSTTSEQIMAHNAGARPQLGSNLENLIPDPAIYKFETGTGYEIRPVIQPDGQAVVFNFNYMYTTNIREPVRADEKHLGRVKRHFVHTDVQLSNFELREVSRYTVALKAARTSRGVPLFEDIPVAGALFRPLPSDESSLQQNLIYSQATIFPTLFDLMGLRWAPAVADMDPLRVSNREFIVRGRHRALENRVYDYASEKVDEFLRIPEANRRADLYRTQETIPYMHPNGYRGPGLDLRDSQLQEGYQPGRAYPQDRFVPGESKEGSPFLPRREYNSPSGTHTDGYPLEEVAPGEPDPEPIIEPRSGPAHGLPTPAAGDDYTEPVIHFRE